MSSDGLPNVLETLRDNRGDPYLSFSTAGLWDKAIPKNASAAAADLCSFQAERLVVTPLVTGPFSTELTSRDDLILAVLSLLLLFVIEGIVTAVLLRTYRGNASNFGFSIRQFVELVRDFRFRSLIFLPLRRIQIQAPTIRAKETDSSVASSNSTAWAPRGTRPRGKINLRLLALATAILFFTSGLEAAILFLSTPKPIDVTNRQASFTLVETLAPDWNAIRDHVGAATVKPCTSIILEGVRQGDTRLTPCLTASGAVDEPSGFDIIKEEDEDVDLTFETQVHEFGAEHTIKIGDDEASYTARVYFTLGDKRRKLLRKRAMFFQRDAMSAYVHRQYVAFLFNHYVHQTNDTSMNMERLKNIKFEFKTVPNENVPLIMLPRVKRFRYGAAMRHTTKARGKFPRGPEALRLGAAVLKAATGVFVTGPDLNDFDMGSGSTWAREALMWREESRVLNWLGLATVVGCALAAYACLRWLLKPIGTAEIAGVWVGRKVGAEEGRGPGLMGEDESKFFKIEWDSDDEEWDGSSNWGSGSLV